MNNLYYSKRKYIVSAFFVVVALIFCIRLFYLQVIDYTFKVSADNNVFRYVTQYPARGLVFDRKGKLLVYNEAAYDLMVVPNQLKPFDTADICNILNISKLTLIEEINKAASYSKFKPSPVFKQLPAKKCAIIQEKLYKFSGFFLQTRTLRKYPQSIAAHLLGYVGEVNEKTVKNNDYYKTGDYIGINGIENAYEEILRGKKGMSIYMVDVHNNIKGSYQEGKYDTAAVVGANITTTIDADLQEYGEMLMEHKTGSIVAIEPATGEILALLTSPTYDPNLLVGNERSENYNRLLLNPLKPLFNRALMAQYPPGSTFKLVNGLIALQDGVVSESTTFACGGGFKLGAHTIKCHHVGITNFDAAIIGSCNTYFCYIFQRLLDNKKFNSVDVAYTSWREKVHSFGLGVRTETDISNEIPGVLFSADHYNKSYGYRKWNAYRIMSMAIGQGELGFTPLQICNMTAAIANRGYFYPPHVLKEVNKQKVTTDKIKQKHNIAIDQVYFEELINAMEKVVIMGTAKNAYFDEIKICGKTGTAQNPHGEDHSIFVAFAPKYNPKIAIAVYVENAGFGSTVAAPIASLMIEKYLKDKVSRTEKELEMKNMVILPKNLK